MAPRQVTVFSLQEYSAKNGHFTEGNAREIKMKEKIKGVFSEFRDFLKEYKVIPLAIAFVMGAAATAFIQSVVKNIIMPLITPFVPNGAWETATFNMGPIVIGWGAFLGAAINFTIIAFVVFIMAKLVLREEKVTKK